MDITREELQRRLDYYQRRRWLMQKKAEQRELEQSAAKSDLEWALIKAKQKQAELEERYNHYHDPRTGRFASGKGGGDGLYYSMGRGSGAVVGASSKINPLFRMFSENENGQLSFL